MKYTMAGMPALHVRNYDVLLVPNLDNKPVVRFAPGSHVGNQRFRILLSLYRQRYLQSEMVGDEDECDNIAREVLETVCKKCVPNGRFFEQGRNNGWEQMDTNAPSTMDMICTALKSEPKDCFYGMERIAKRQRTGVPPCGFELRCPAFSAYVDSPNAFDVVCESNGLGLQVSNRNECTGNNRLRVMFQIRLAYYKVSSPKVKQSMAEEIATSILEDVAGRFLQSQSECGKFKVMSQAAAIDCVKKAFDSEAGLNKKRFRDGEVQKLVQRKHKKAILDRLEKQRKDCPRRIPSFKGSSSVPMTTTFNALSRRTVSAQAA